jgi:N-acetyl-alpha-D-glucosaminyl L-malate synthase BshA
MLAAGRNGNRRKLPFVTTLHGTDITIVGQDRSYLPVTRFSIEQSDGVTSISKYLRDRTIAEFDVHNEIEVIHNFVNCDLYRRDLPDAEDRSKYADANEPIFVHLSNFRPVKRVQDVVEVFDRVNKKIPSRLLMIGDGPDRSAAEYLARKKGVRDRVQFLGKQDNVQTKLAVSDVMIMPSELESFGLAALEGMACKVPSIATNVGGVPELIEHGKTGYLADVGDVEAMGRYATELVSDPAKLKVMGESARFEAQSRFCASSIIENYIAYYARVLERSS